MRKKLSEKSRDTIFLIIRIIIGGVPGMYLTFEYFDLKNKLKELGGTDINLTGYLSLFLLGVLIIMFAICISFTYSFGDICIYIIKRRENKFITHISIISTLFFMAVGIIAAFVFSEGTDSNGESQFEEVPLIVYFYYFTTLLSGILSLFIYHLDTQKEVEGKVKEDSNPRNRVMKIIMFFPEKIKPLLETKREKELKKANEREQDLNDYQLKIIQRYNDASNSEISYWH